MSLRVFCQPAMVAGTCVLAVAFAPTALGQGCTNPVGPDVLVCDIQSHTNFTAQQIGADWYDAFSFGTYSSNIGNANLLWQSFSNSSNRHPAISQNMFKYRVVNGTGRFEQVGQSWLKHGFFALTDNLCCTCNGQGNQVLGVGCADPYTAARNGTQNGLGPKWQVNATTGWFSAVANPAFSGSTARRLRVRSAEMDTTASGSQYFVECQYLSQDDAALGNKNNNASYRPVTITGGPNEFSAAVASATVRGKPAIEAWKVIDPAVTITNVTTPESAHGVSPTPTYPLAPYDPNCCTSARAVVGAKVTDLGGGIYRYEFAVQNLNSDRSIGSFSVPLSGPVVITNIGFHDVDYHSGDGEGSVTRDGTNWPGVVSATEIKWQTTAFASNPNANALRWGTLYNFRFDANTPPTSGNVTLGMWKVVSNVLAASVIPTPVVVPPACLADFDGSGGVGTADLLELINAWGPCPGCPEDLDGSGTVGTADLLMLINDWGPCDPG